MDANSMEVKEASSTQNSECDETEPDGDSVWSSRSVSTSEAGTDNASSLGSPLRDLPTVRAKEEGDDEIHKLIVAAEALVLERARLKITINTLPQGAMESHISNTTDATPTTSVPTREKHIDAFPDNRSAAANSCYFTDTDNTGHASYLSSSLSAEKSINLDVYGEKDQHSVQSRESLSSTGCDSLMLSKVSDSSLKGSSHHQPENIVPAENTPTSIPRLSLEPYRDLDYERQTGVSDERVAINKVEKEACNSSIRGSSGGASQPTREPQIIASGDVSFNGLFAWAGDQDASVMVHEEGSCLLNLALSATSNLKRLTRLLRQVGALQLGPDTPRVGQSVLHELEQYETQQQSLEMRLSTAATHLQMAVAQVRGLEGQQQEQQQQAAAMQRNALTLLEQVETGLESCGLKHMLTVTSPRRRCPARVLEDVGSAAALLVGELSRKTQRITRAEAEASHLRKELHGVYEELTHRDSSAKLRETEAWQAKKQSEEDLTSLRQCLAQAESNLTEAQMENTRLNEENKRQANESSAAFAALQRKLCEVQHRTEARVSELERDLHLSSKEKQHLETSVGELKDQLTLRTQQMHVVEEENSLLIESLRAALKQQQTELEQLRQHLEATNTEKSHLSYTLNELKQEAAATEEELDQAKEKSGQLNRRVTELEEEQRDTQKTLQSKGW